jgi:hypothetical protein
VGGTSSDIGYGLAVDGSGNVHVTGVFVNTVDFDPGAGTANLTSAGGGDIFIAKYDASGNYVWANRVGGPNSDSGLGLAVDGSGNVHLTGFFTNTVDFDPGAGTANLVSVGAGDIFIAKYDASGNYVWAKGVGGASGDDIGSGIGLDGNGNIYLTGYFQGTNLDFDPGAGTANLTSAGVFDIFIAKYEASGNYVWANRVGGTSADISYGLALDGSGNMHITGYFEGANVDFDPGAGTANLVSVGAGDIFIAKYDASGNYVWANRVGGASTDIGRGIALDGSGNVHVTGFFLGSDVDFDPGAGTANLTSAGGADIFIAKYDPSGNYLLAMPAGNSSDDQGFCITAGGAGKINAGGHFGGTVDFDPGAGTANRTAVSSNYDIFIAQYSTAPTGIVISGNIEHHNGAPSGTGVKDVTVTLSGADTGSDLTPASGDYEFSTTATGDFTVAPTKSLNKLNGVTVADAVAIQQHLTGSTPIASNYLKVAADVNKSNSISTIDATVINQSLLGNPTALAQFKTSWRFVPQSHTMSDPPWGFPENISLTAVTSDQTGQDFYGIKTGDLVAAYANPAGFKGGAPMTLRVQDILLHAGQTAELVFRTGQLDDLAAFQLALHFDPQTLELLEIQPLDALPLTADHFGLFGIAQGEIRVVWSQPEGMALEEGSPLFTLRFKALQSGLWMSELLFLDDAVLPAYAYNAVLDESAVSLDFDLNTATISQDVAAGLQLRQNRPNPFDRETTIGFVLPEACDAQLRVFDVNGIELLRINKAYGAGNHEETLRLEHAGGVLFCELATPYGVVVRKMMVVKN